MNFNRFSGSRSTHTGRGSPRRKGRRALFLRPVIDAAVALSLFFVVTCALTSAPLWALPSQGVHVATEIPRTALQALAEPGPAPIVEIATAHSPDSGNAVFRRTSNTAAFVLVALAFSIVAALNLAIIRHVRHAYVRRRDH